jgi:transposase-like protein
MTSRTNRIDSSPKQGQKAARLSPGVKDRRHQAIARYLAGDKIEAICREMGCAKSWLYTWRARYQTDDPTWAQERPRRPRSNPRPRPERIEEAIVHLARP